MRFLFCCLLAAGLAWSAPALPGERTFTQPDGTTFKGRAQGDEFLHWIETEQGEILLFSGEHKRFEHAVIDAGRLRPSGVPFAPGVAAAKSVSKPDKKALYELWKKKRAEAFRRMHPEP